MLKRIESLFTLLLLICSIPFGALAQSSPINYGVNFPATDALGRILPDYQQVGGPKKDRFVGLFYWTWHTRQSGPTGIPHDVSKILKVRPEAIDHFDDPIWPTDKGAYYWGEPLFGYYRDTDRWVLMRHAEMLGAAGVDVIVFDCTNGDITWKESYRKLCEVFSEARKQGIHTPAIAFMLGLFGQPESRTALEKLYKDFYEPGLYKDLWFYWKGKPLIMAYPALLADAPDDPAETKLRRAIKSFFTFRPGQPAYNKGEEKPNQWGWLQVYPQHGFIKGTEGRYEQVPVGVAQNWSRERGLTAMNAPDAFGRSYTHAHGQILRPGAVNFGYNFQEQWDHALKMDPEFIFITGWNEWIAGRYKLWQQQPNAFPDEFDEEHSRDIEPMKGGHKDDYYYQMVANIRKYKGVAPEPMASGQQTIRIDSAFAEWGPVKPDYAAFAGNTIGRNSAGWGELHYENHSGRNDIVEAKVARDERSLFFYVKTQQPLTSPDGDSWMRLFIDMDRNHATGWEGYDYMISREGSGGKALLEKSEKGWKWQPVALVAYAMKGTEMEIRVPRAALGATGKLDFEFKWSDHMQAAGDIMDFWINGDVAPLGRFNFHYREK